jgi:DNA helicase II / ATP-dependent DNA helicase PcrA
VLKRLKESFEQEFRLQGQRVAVITYTNAACDEIISRLSYDPLFAVSTIHSFVWDLIKPYQEDIRIYMKNRLKEELKTLEDNQLNGRAGTKTYIDREKAIENKKERIKNIDSIKSFTYNPNGENRERESLNHSEVIRIGAFFMEKKELMQKILVRSFPILLIDESQDTNKHLMDAFFKIQSNNRNVFSLGLFGDTMQRIYSDGKLDLGENLPSDWEKPVKIMNHRCPERIVDLINKIRYSYDNNVQTARNGKKIGFARLFICSSNINKQDAEKLIAEKMSQITNDKSWIDEKYNFKKLILEHHMAAKRLGFLNLYEGLNSIESYKSGLLNGSLSGLNFFTQIILPIIEASNQGDKFKIANVVKQYSPLMKIKPNEPDKLSIISDTKSKVDILISLWDNNEDPKCLNILQCVAKSKLFDIPDSLYSIAHRSEEEQQIAQTENLNENIQSDISHKWEKALNSPFSEIKMYESYINEKSNFDTHQGVKGLEFPNVMLIIDDDEARGFLFSYDKLFGVKRETETDLENLKSGKDTAIGRTKRLFYVACSRAEKSLAIVMYSSNPDAVKEFALREEWFDESEIELI